MADTDIIKTVGADGKLMSTTRSALATAISHWIWCSDKGFTITQQQQASFTDDLRFALAAIKSGAGNVG